MNEFFDNYCWSIISMIAGLMGISMIFDLIFKPNSIFYLFMIEILKGLM